MGGCAGGAHNSFDRECCDKVSAEQPVPLSAVAPEHLGKAKAVEQPLTPLALELGAEGRAKVPSEAFAQPLCVGVAEDEEPTKPNAELYIGIPESAEDAVLVPSEIKVGIAEEGKAKDGPPEQKAKTLLEDIGRRQGVGGPKLPIISRAKTEGDLAAAPPVPRARSLPVMLPAAAVRSRSRPCSEPDASSPATATATTLPAPKSPSTALAPSRRRKRRSVTFGLAECREFIVDVAAAEACPRDGPAE